MVIISHHWSNHANHWYADPTPRAFSLALRSQTSISNSASSGRTGRCHMQSTNIRYPYMHMSCNIYSSTPPSVTSRAKTSIDHSRTFRT